VRIVDARPLVASSAEAAPFNQCGPMRHCVSSTTVSLGMLEFYLAFKLPAKYRLVYLTFFGEEGEERRRVYAKLELRPRASPRRLQSGRIFTSRPSHSASELVRRNYRTTPFCTHRLPTLVRSICQRHGQPERIPTSSSTTSLVSLTGLARSHDTF
jgi:hypothetical protein